MKKDRPNIFCRFLRRIIPTHKNANREKVNYAELRKQYLPLLEECTCIQDFISIHRQLENEGIKVNIRLENQADNYAAVGVNIATTEHYYCDSYDRDSTYHGCEMIKFEKTPSLNEYDYYNYWKAWSIYYRNLYIAITGEKCQYINFPQWLRNLK